MRRNNYYNLGLLLTSAMTLQMLFIGELKAQSWLQPSPTLALTPFDQQTINIASAASASLVLASSSFPCLQSSVSNSAPPPRFWEYSPAVVPSL
jgi:hypothetical protein